MEIGKVRENKGKGKMEMDETMVVVRMVERMWWGREGVIVEANDNGGEDCVREKKKMDIDSVAKKERESKGKKGERGGRSVLLVKGRREGMEGPNKEKKNDMFQIWERKKGLKCRIDIK